MLASQTNEHSLILNFHVVLVVSTILPKGYTKTRSVELEV